ncbi:hypothetical protein Barb6XT_01863 [Bacteroidales bacterium Barb6XT]|nr:hypothetical protein Barb6XT_01863 [Bacteroidales bacterium Barb6XT]
MSVWGVDVKLNKVKIGLKDCSDKKVSEFKKNITDHPAVKFEQRDEIIVDEERR